MYTLALALIPCVPTIFLSGVVLLLAWKNRERIETLEAGLGTFKIQFSKNHGLV